MYQGINEDFEKEVIRNTEYEITIYLYNNFNYSQFRKNIEKEVLNALDVLIDKKIIEKYIVRKAGKILLTKENEI